jgi:FdhD protein
MRTTPCTVTRHAPSGAEVFEDVVAVEEPLEISAAWIVDGEPREKVLTVTMRTPGDDFDLAVGFLLSEGLIASVRDVESIRHWASPNRVRVALKPEARIDTSRIGRNFLTTSACGVCGKTSIDALAADVAPLSPTQPVDRTIITSIPRLLQEAQSAFRETGGVHGAAIVDRAGKLLCVREDVGRHNAVDKVIGAFATGSFSDTLLVVSSRASFEIAQKAIACDIPALVSIGAPSSLAIEMARRFNLTLIGFVRDGRFNVYAGEVTS